MGAYPPARSARTISRLFLLAACLLAAAPVRGQPSLLNFAHLDHLTERKTVRGVEVSVVHVYANYPTYDWVGAAESGQEGVACVDDAARAAVLCLRAFELRKDRDCLERARGYLRFVLQMQAPNGEFYNFIFGDGTINRVGKTSAKSFGWWAARGVWAMSTGARILGPADPALADTLKRAVRRSLPHVRQLLARYRHFARLGNYRAPRWLLYDSGADATSELLLGLLEFYRVNPDTSLAGVILRLSEGLTAMQDGNAYTYPYGLHRSWETMWHMWGNSQTDALASAGMLLKSPGLTRSAELEALSFYPRLLAEGFIKEMDVARTGSSLRFEQIAYAVRPMAAGLARLFETTGKREYAVMAGLAASWFTGNNPAGALMYDSTTGRGLDGVRDSGTVNLNSGAESTVEALLTLLEVEKFPEARGYLRYRRITGTSTPSEVWALFRDPGLHELVLRLDAQAAVLQILEGDEAARFVRGRQPR